MDANEKFEYWLDIARYDLETASDMLSCGRWLYVVFMCQQAIEKLVKGLYTLYVDDNAPRIHSIMTIIERYEDKLPSVVTNEMSMLFNTLSKYYLNNRYPDFISKISSQINKNEAAEILAGTKEAFEWLSTLKP